MSSRVDSRNLDAYLTATLDEYLTTLHDNLFNRRVGLSYMNGSLGKKKRGGSPKKMHSSGNDIIVPLMYAANNTVKSYDGAELLNTTLQDGITNAKFSWSYYSGSVGLLGKEKRNNKGKHAILNLLQSKTDQLEISFSDRLNKDLLKSARSSVKDIHSFHDIISDTVTVGGLAPGTFPWWVPLVNTSVGAFATQGINAMRKTINTLNSRGGGGADLMLTDQTVFEAYDDSQTDKQRFNDTNTMDAGFTNIMFMGIPMVFDLESVAGEILYLNSEHLHWEVHREADITMSPEGFQTPIGQDVTTAKLLFQGQVTTNNRRRLAKDSGITT